MLFPGWFCVGRADGLAGPGDYLAADVAGESIIVVRGPDGTCPAATTCAGTGAPAGTRGGHPAVR